MNEMVTTPSLVPVVLRTPVTLGVILPTKQRCYDSLTTQVPGPCMNGVVNRMNKKTLDTIRRTRNSGRTHQSTVCVSMEVGGKDLRQR